MHVHAPAASFCALMAALDTRGCAPTIVISIAESSAHPLAPMEIHIADAANDAYLARRIYVSFHRARALSREYTFRRRK